MLTITEILSDVAAAPGFSGISVVDVNSRGRNGETPLHWMAVLGDANAIRLLLDAGADVSSPDDEGNTPLHVAVKWRQTEAARVLLERGADRGRLNDQGQNPLDVAKHDGFGPTIEVFQ